MLLKLALDNSAIGAAKEKRGNEKEKERDTGIKKSDYRRMQ